MKHTLTGIGALMLLNPALQAAGQKQPNFFIISCEDISPYLDFYGDKTANTPNLDALAKESTIYDNAFATVGVSGPSRSGIITGMYPVSIGTHNMRTANDVMGWGNRDYTGTPANRTDQNGTKFGNYSVVTPDKVRCFTTYLRQNGYYCTNNPKTDYQFAAPLSAWDENGNNADFRNRAKGQPFFAIYNLNETHESQIWKMAGKPLTVAPQKVKLHSYWQNSDTARIDMARNYSNIELMDKEVGKLIAMLKKSGEFDNTIIIFFSDHGGPLPRGKRLIYDSGLHAPFMIRYPDQKRVQHNERMISYIDIAPTILSLAGVPVPAHIQGKAFAGSQETKPREYIYGSADRFDECYDRVRCIRDKEFMLVKNYNTNLPRYMDVAYRKQIPMMREMLRLRDAGQLNKTQMLWFEPTKPQIEFYNVKDDPEQVHDLANNPTYKAKIKSMLRQLEKWQADVKDMGAIPEAKLVETFWPDNQQPVTARPTVRSKGNIVLAQCSTKGADIVYRFSDSADEITELDHWLVYNKQIQTQKGKYLHIRATRIGFRDSEAAIIKF